MQPVPCLTRSSSEYGGSIRKTASYLRKNIIGLSLGLLETGLLEKNWRSSVSLGGEQSGACLAFVLSQGSVFNESQKETRIAVVVSKQVIGGMRKRDHPSPQLVQRHTHSIFGVITYTCTCVPGHVLLGMSQQERQCELCWQLGLSWGSTVRASSVAALPPGWK